MSNDILLNPGPISSFNSLTYNIGPQLDNIRNQYVHGSSPRIVLDLRNMTPGRISVSALASLLSITHKLSRFLSAPLDTVFSLNPQVQQFLHNVDFFLIARRLNILTWDERTVGGFRSNNMNPHTKLLYFGDVVYDIENYDLNDIIRIKALHKQKIGPNFSLRCAEIFRGFNSRLQYTVENTTLELITNSLIHGKDVAFVGIARNSKRISVSVCDSGIGFRRSLVNTYQRKDVYQDANNVQSLIIGSLIQKHEHGLRLAIGQVLNYDDLWLNLKNEGWVIISSFNSEIRWQKENWARALEFYRSHSIDETLPDVDQILGPMVSGKLEQFELEKGYWKNFRKGLVGTRITFEIPLA